MKKIPAWLQKQSLFLRVPVFLITVYIIAALLNLAIPESDNPFERTEDFQFIWVLTATFSGLLAIYFFRKK